MLYDLITNISIKLIKFINKKDYEAFFVKELFKFHSQFILPKHESFSTTPIKTPDIITNSKRVMNKTFVISERNVKNVLFENIWMDNPIIIK